MKFTAAGVSVLDGDLATADALLKPSIPRNVDKDAGLSFKQLTLNQGLRFEEHQVMTLDGYYLTIFRMKSPTTRAGAPVVFF